MQPCISPPLTSVRTSTDSLQNSLVSVAFCLWAKTHISILSHQRAAVTGNHLYLITILSPSTQHPFYRSSAISSGTEYDSWHLHLLQTGNFNNRQPNPDLWSFIPGLVTSAGFNHFHQIEFDWLIFTLYICFLFIFNFYFF